MHSTLFSKFLEKLKNAQVEYACGKLEKPSDKTAFGFGEACGVYKGLKLAERLLEEAIGEEDDRT